MPEGQKIRFHRRIGFFVGGEIRYVDKGDHIDLPREITESPYFTAVMGDGLVEAFNGAAPSDPTLEEAGMADALALLESAKAEGKAEAQAELKKAQNEAKTAREELANLQAEVKKTQSALEKTTKPAPSKDK